MILILHFVCESMKSLRYKSVRESATHFSDDVFVWKVSILFIKLCFLLYVCNYSSL